MAADGPEKPKKDHNEWRFAMISAGLDYLAEQWPASKTWPVACAGFSGGAKRSAFMGAEVLKAQRKLIGMLMGGCNQDMASEAIRENHPPSSAYKQTPIFLSSGKTDTIAKPEQHQYVLNSMKGSGFRKVRLESFPGAHDVYPPHTSEALRWFIAESTPRVRPSPTSSFEKFFKKP